MTTSVIIPDRDDPRVGQAVASVLAQEGAGAVGEILVVGSDAPGAVPRDERVRFLANGVANGAALPGANRNAGIREARGDVLIFLDADCVAQPGWLRALQAGLESAPAASGAVCLDGGDYWASAYNVASFHEFHCGAPAGPRPYLPALTLAVTRAAVEQTGPLDETLPRCEDLDWTIRLSLACGAPAFVPGAAVRHYPRTSPAALWRTWFQSGYYSSLVRRRYPDVAYAANSAALLARPHWLRLLAPAIAAAVTARIFRQPALWRFAHVAPAVWLTRLAWCWGAALRPEGLECL